MAMKKRKLPVGMWQRGNVYYARFRYRGRIVRKRLAGDFEAAKDMLLELRSRIARGDFGLLDNDYTWADLKAEYLQAKKKNRRVKDYERCLRHFEKYQAVGSIRQIDYKYVDGYRDWRAANGILPGKRPACPRTINLEVGVLVGMLRLGVKRKLLGSNPLADLKPLPHDSVKKERRALSWPEVEAIFASAPARYRPVLRLFAATGMRKNEIATLQFSDIDFDGKCLTVRKSIAKNHQSRVIPLDDETLTILAGLQKAAAVRQPVAGDTVRQTEQQRAAFSRDHVFVTAANTPLRNNLLRMFYAACKRAKIEGAKPGGSVDLHSLRVTFATMILGNGANPRDVQKILGHKTLDMTMRIYAKATDQGTRAAIGKLPFVTVSNPDHILSIADEKRTESATPTKSQLQVATG